RGEQVARRVEHVEWGAMNEVPAPEKSSKQTDEGPRLRREVLVVFAVTVVITGLVTVIQATVPWASDWTWLGVALAFLVLPGFVVRKFRGEDPVEAGMRFGAVGRGVLVGG